VSLAVKEHGGAYQYVSDELKSKRDIMIHALRTSGNALEYAPENFKSDRDIVLIAVSNDGEALSHADESFRQDQEIILAAVRSRTNLSTVYSLMSDTLLNDVDFLTKILCMDEDLFDELANNFKVIDQNLKKDPEVKMIQKINKISRW
jgi:hypothetical protein